MADQDKAKIERAKLAKSAADDQATQARTILKIRAMSTNLGKFMPMKLRPFTKCFLAPDLNHQSPDNQEAQALGIIFTRWDKVRGEVLIRQTTKTGGPVVREGTALLAQDESGNEIGLLLPERWMWLQLLGKYKGLTFGNL